MSDLAEQLAARRVALRHTHTQVTTPDGFTRVEEVLPDGSYHLSRVTAAGPGFVVDTKPDLRCCNVLDHVLLGSQDVAHDLDILKNGKVTHILNVATGILNLFEGWFIYKTIHALDTPNFRIIEIFDECCDFMHGAVMSGGCVLVHCNAGVSRAASVVAAYLMRHHGMSMAGALAFIKTKRPFICPNPGFRQQLIEYQNRLTQA